MHKNKNKSDIFRLDRFISNQISISREESKELIKKRVVTVNGETAKLFDMKIDTAKDKVEVYGNEVLYRKNIYIMMNKPQGVVCSTRDGESKTVLDLVPEELKRKGLFPAGRLDKDTEGFVFLTDDGELSHNILSPKKHVSKLYFARLENEAEESYIKAFESGLHIDDGDICLPAKIEILENKNEVLITLNEGMFHQVKRMIAAVGNKVVYLKRIKIADLELDETLALGECRELTGEELIKISG